MTYIPQPTHRAEFGWSPKAYVAIMRVDMGQAADELSKFSHEVPREEQVYQLQEVIKFASKVVDNAQLALRMLNTDPSYMDEYKCTCNEHYTCEGHRA